MGFMSRLKSMVGFGNTPTIAVSGTTLMVVPDNSAEFYVTGASTPVVSSINASLPIQAGRRITFEATASVGSSVVFTNNAASTTKGQMDLGSGDVTLGSTDVLCVKQRSDGVWVRQYSTDN